MRVKTARLDILQRKESLMSRRLSVFRRRGSENVTDRKACKFPNTRKVDVPSATNKIFAVTPSAGAGIFRFNGKFLRKLRATAELHLPSALGETLQNCVHLKLVISLRRATFW